MVSVSAAGRYGILQHPAFAAAVVAAEHVAREDPVPVPEPVLVVAVAAEILVGDSARSPFVVLAVHWRYHHW